MEDTTTKPEYISLSDAGELFPKARSYSTMYRWATTGLHTGGTPIILQTIPIGTLMYTTREWVEEFQAKI